MDSISAERTGFRINHSEKKTVPGEGRLSFLYLLRQALPEIWSYQFFTGAALIALSVLVHRLALLIAGSSGKALTTANLRGMLMNWRTPILILLFSLLVFFYIFSEIYAQIYLCGDILAGRPVTLRGEFRKTLSALKRFLTPDGISIVVFLVFCVLIYGMGFSISTSSLFSCLPEFVFDAIKSSRLYMFFFLAGIAVMIIFGYLFAFSVHAVLLDGMTPKEAKRYSLHLLWRNQKRFILTLLKIAAVILFVRMTLYLLTDLLPALLIEKGFADLPAGSSFDLLSVTDPGQITVTEMRLVLYRVLSCIAVFTDRYITVIATLLCGSYSMMEITRLYRSAAGDAPAFWPQRPGKVKIMWRASLMIGVFAAVVTAAAVIGLMYPAFFGRNEQVKVIAHRAGGSLAQENSLEGLSEAIGHGCYGSEIDIQRTKDGHYVVTHDKTFKRLAGVKKSPDEMTLSEIRALGNGEAVRNGDAVLVPTLEEMLDTAGGEEVLLIELKGKTADRQMVDDVAAIVRGRDAVEDVVLISLKYDLIDYAETQYPEFRTGLVLVAGMGDLTSINCDVLLMEEALMSEAMIDEIHQAGKEIMVWTVNSKSDLLKYLDSSADAVITDEIILAGQLQEILDSRSDFQTVKARVSRLFE